MKTNPEAGGLSLIRLSSALETYGALGTSGEPGREWSRGPTYRRPASWDNDIGSLMLARYGDNLIQR
jgi:hypothetical protein